MSRKHYIAIAAALRQHNTLPVAVRGGENLPSAQEMRPAGCRGYSICLL